MFRLFPIIGLFVVYQSWACTCAPISVDEAKESADVVFAGIVEDYTLLDSKGEWEPRILLKFDVARVWKGSIGSKFTMHTNIEGSSCGGFFRDFLKPGTNLIVYGFGRKAESWKNNNIDGAPNAASLSVIGDRKSIDSHSSIDKLSDDEIVYTTNICTRTGLVLYAVDDFKGLGKFKKYRKLDVKPDPIALDAITWKQNSLPEGCGELGNARRWEVINPPKMSEELISLLEDGSMYKSIPKPHITKYQDYWVSDKNGNYGLCRRSVDPEIVCGQATIEYSSVAADSEPKQKKWKVASGGVQTYCKLHE